MPITQEQIQEHTRLLNSLNALDYVPTAQEDNNARLEVVLQELATKEHKLAAHTKKTKSEYKDTQKLNSSIRRMMIWVRDGGSEGVATRVEKEQTEYIEALRQEKEVQLEVDALVEERDQRTAVANDLSKKEKSIEESKQKIEALYNGLFAGTTPEYPEEGEAGRAFKRSNAEYTSLQVKVNNETNALVKLIKTEKGLRLCINKLQEAQQILSKSRGSLSVGEDWSQSVVTFTLTSGTMSSILVNQWFREAQMSVPGVIQPIGEIKIIYREYTQEVIGDRIANVEVPGLDGRIGKNIQDLEDVHTRLAGEIEKCHTRISDYRSRLKYSARDMQNLRKELAKIRCEIMLRVTDPATIIPSTHRSAANAIEHGDSELPIYSPTTNGKSSANRAAATSIAVPTYDEAQNQAETSNPGGFKFTMGGANSPNDQVPRHAPPGIGPAPGPGGVGGFRGTTASELPGRSPLALKIPVPQLYAPSAKGLLSPLLTSPPEATPTTSTGALTPRPVSWSLNPYAGDMIRQASLSEEQPGAPGSWNGHPFADMLSEEPKGEQK